MNPSDVRIRILQDHDRLRQYLSDLEAAVEAMLLDAADEARVAELVRNLQVELSRHTELEDTILAPALMEIDAWGAVRSKQLLAHHQTQRREIGELSNLFDAHLGHHDIAQVISRLILDVRHDMAHEERDLLSADLLRDDVIAVGSNSG
jgi:hypothetical protein